MPKDETIPLILFSGLAADKSVFGPQAAAFPHLIVPDWPIPKRHDTLEIYSERLIETLQLPGNAVIGGASFGGIIALHIAEKIKPRGVILIGSVHAPNELSRIIQLARPLRFLAGLIPVRLLQICCAPLCSNSFRRTSPHFWALVRQFRNCNPTVFKWSVARVLDWSDTPEPRSPVFHIQGERDHVMPESRTKADKIVPGGGHVISLTHALQVNAFIRFVFDQIEPNTK